VKRADLDIVQEVIERYAETAELAGSELGDKVLGNLFVMLVELRAARSVVAAARHAVAAPPIPAGLTSPFSLESLQLLRGALEAYDALERYEHG
jgi:hypothetical protein